MSATNKNHDVLIKRIGKALKQVVQLECDHNIALGSLGEVLRDCRAALSRKYVPMTEAEWEKLYAEYEAICFDKSPSPRYIEHEIIRRAGLEVQE